MSYRRRAPAAPAMAGQVLEWGERFGMGVPLRFADVTGEERRLADLGLADLSALPRLGVKGSATSDWLSARGLDVPGTIYGWTRLPGGGLLVRVDRTELLVEDGIHGGPVGELDAELGWGGEGVYRVERQDASFLLSGRRAPRVLAQTCALDLAATGDSFVRTRLAVTSCSLKREDVGATPGFRIWCDPTYARYLWTELAAIAAELGGGPVGWLCVEHAAADPSPGG